MEYKKTIENSTCIITMSGKFTFADHTTFKKLFDVFNDTAIAKVEFNVQGVEFVDSAALGLFLLARDEIEKNEKEIYITHPQGQVQKMFEISRFYEIFNIS